MTWRIPILLGLMTLSVPMAASADPVRPRAVSFSVSAGKPVGLPGQDSAMPALGVGFSYAWTRRLAFEATVTTMKVPAYRWARSVRGGCYRLRPSYYAAQCVAAVRPRCGRRHVR